MIIIIASVQVRPDRLDEALVESRKHVARSRLEPGCLSHAVHQDAEDPCRLVFLERWADQAAVDAHFAVPEARAFAKSLGAMADTPAQLQLFEATPRG
jgi:quinol monooxygenase YgiN